MAIFDAEELEDEDSEKEEPQDKEDYRGYPFVLLLMLPLIIYPFFTGRGELIIGVSLSATMNCLAILMCWDLRKHAWFWIVVALMQATHMSLAFFAHWPRVTFSKFTLMPFGLMYYGLTVGAVRLIANKTIRSTDSSSSELESLTQESETQEPRDKKNHRHLSVALLILPLIIFPFFANRAEFVIGVSLSLFMNIVAIALSWDFRKNIRFWIAVALLWAFDVSFAFVAHWPRATTNRLIFLPLGVAYFGLAAGAFWAFDKFIFKPGGSPQIDSSIKPNRLTEL